MRRMARAGIQLIICGQRNRDYVEGVLHDVHHAGFAGAETGNLYRQVGREDVVRRYFEENELALCGCHAGFSEFLEADKVREDLYYLNSLNSRYLMCSGGGDRQRG